MRDGDRAPRRARRRRGRAAALPEPTSAIRARHDSPFPWGTLAVNAAGSLLLGFLAGLPTDPRVALVLGTGLCGTLTTYSTFSYETLRLIQRGARWYGVANVAASIVVGLGVGFCGLAVAAAITGNAEV